MPQTRDPLSGTDPSGYTSCDAKGNAVDCANAAGPGGEAKVYQQDAGSRIKITVGTVKNNGDGSATFTNNAGQSRTFGGNGGNTTQGMTGTSADGRKGQSAAASEKNVPENAQSVATPQQNESLEAVSAGDGTSYTTGPNAAESKDMEKGRAASDEARIALQRAGLLERRYAKSEFKEAMDAWASVVDPIAESHGVEISALIVELEGAIYLNSPYSDGRKHAVEPLGGGQPSGLILGFIHTHPYSESVSLQDRLSVRPMTAQSGIVAVFAIATKNGVVSSVYDSVNKRTVPWENYSPPLF